MARGGGDPMLEALRRLRRGAPPSSPSSPSDSTRTCPTCGAGGHGMGHEAAGAAMRPAVTIAITSGSPHAMGELLEGEEPEDEDEDEAY